MSDSTPSHTLRAAAPNVGDTPGGRSIACCGNRGIEGLPARRIQDIMNLREVYVTSTAVANGKADKMGIPISQMDFGRIDAKRELLDAHPVSIRRFLSTFQPPPNLRIQDFLDGRKSFVIGLKGTGKTALLLYVDRTEVENGSETEFVLFKSDFSEEDRRRIQNNAQYFVADDARGKNRFQQDFENEWIMFLTQLLVQKLKGIPEYKSVPIIHRLASFIHYLELQPVSRALSLFPNLKGGELLLKAGSSGFDAEFKGDIEFDSKKRTVAVKSAVDFLTNSMNAIPGGPRKIVIFVDELEISYGDPASFERDARLIRDLVVVVSRLNDRFRKRGASIRFIVAIRSEVLRTVAALG